jgi:hypothetical protein
VVADQDLGRQNAPGRGPTTGTKHKVRYVHIGAAAAPLGREDVRESHRASWGVSPVDLLPTARGSGGASPRCPRSPALQADFLLRLMRHHLSPPLATDEIHGTRPDVTTRVLVEIVSEGEFRLRRGGRRARVRGGGSCGGAVWNGAGLVEADLVRWMELKFDVKVGDEAGSSGKPEMTVTRLRDVVSDIVMDAVEEGLAPAEELRVLEALHKEPRDERILRRLRRSGGRDVLGFGTGELVGVLTALLWLAINEGMREATGAATRSGLARLRGWLTRLFRRPRRVVNVPELTPEQLRVVGDLIVASLTDAGMPNSEARIVAELVIGRIALAWTDDPAPEDPAPESD